MRRKYNVFIPSEIPFPSYNRSYRVVLFVNHAPEGRLGNVYVTASKSDEVLINKNVNVIYDYIKADSFKNNQYSIILRLWDLFKLFLKMIKFRFSNKGKNIDFIRSGTTFISFLILLSQKRKIPYFADICDFYFELYEVFNMPFAKIFKPFIFRLEKLALKRIDIIFVDTVAQRRYLADKMGIDEKRCIVLPNGIKTQFFPFIENKDAEIQEKYGISKDDRVLFYAGDISKMDGIEMMIDYVNKNKKVKALIVGKGNIDYLMHLKEKIEKLGLNGKVILDSFKPYNELYRYISVSDVCLAPFRITATSNTVECAKIITYLLVGKPVLATKADGLKSLYKDKLNYFKDGNYDDFSEKLTRMLDYNISHEKRMELRSLGEKFDFEKIMSYEYRIFDFFFDDRKQDFRKYDYL